MAAILDAPRSGAALPSVALVERADAALPWAALSVPGPGRGHNEDRWRVDDARAVLVLGDGMGGYSAGEVASEIAVRTVSERAGALLDARLGAEDALVRATVAAHAGIVAFAHARPECLGMGTTLVAAAVSADRLTLAHVGDSRAYRMRDGVLSRLTADHSIGQQMVEAGRLTQAQVRRLPARGILTRALGIGAAPPVPTVTTTDWRPGDLLLLCSDGLTDRLDDAAIAALLARPEARLGARAQALIAEALAAGCTDDVTVLLAGGTRGARSAH
jgi:serine/threonine protein phosphatase PrpC